MTELMGMTFHSLRAKWQGKLRPMEFGSAAVMAIWRMPSIRDMPMATMVALLR